ncbi:Rv2231c family pyridoxal phosphate-dependent protein CobC, partial [Modestobacter caceresii]|uniref:Rv2231c family pyridoxal phosphate-dependent protein CobC n=1 Tax=Modestobacter caceresii TaxID=1522368 RepID=UPI001E3C83D5
AARRGWPLTGHPADALAAVPVPAPSVRVAAAVGTASVAEAAALLEGGRLVVGKTVHGRVTVAVAVDPDLRHHGDAEVAPGLVDLAVNVRADAPPPWLRAVLVDALDASAAYPDPRPARAAVAAAHGRDPAEVLLTAGAAETFTLVARALRPRRAVVVHPSFTEPEAALRAAGHPVERLLLPAPGYRLDPAAVPADADLVVVGNPTNPTSVLHPAADLAALARPGRVLLVDEAFADTVPGEPESLTGRSDLPGLLVVRSLTKTWGLAGLRVGYALGPAELVAALAAQQPHWPVSTPALAALTACTGPAARAEAEEVAHQLTAHRAVLLAVLPPAVEVVADPRSSFVLVRVREGARVRERLREHGWAVRRGDTFPGLTSDHLRIAVRDPETSRAFASALAETLDPNITTEEVR